MNDLTKIIQALEQYTGKKTMPEQQERLNRLFIELGENLKKIKTEKPEKLSILQEKIKNNSDYPKQPLEVRLGIREFFIKQYVRAALDIVGGHDGIPMKDCLEIIENFNKFAKGKEKSLPKTETSVEYTYAPRVEGDI